MAMFAPLAAAGGAEAAAGTAAAGAAEGAAGGGIMRALGSGPLGGILSNLQFGGSAGKNRHSDTPAPPSTDGWQRS
ncbi:hypothetical protein ACFVGM_08680 [Kitasatospora purpeofusca]|uniref:hypothetical protein n=1 Tax=Kitasatospora purpeofusca TaxID=67352 RepID=UPI00367E5451